ncbi:MAG: type II secretion system protein [Candidatus Wallbacteria bacterium]|nr:type II secretion system protein [Candidatus Wallbacteria bacterium]
MKRILNRTVGQDDSDSVSGGFTLVELIVALAIISILSFMVVPRVIQYVGASKKNVLSYNLTTIRRSLVSYARDHDGCYPRCLRELVDRGYMAGLPQDPYTETSLWEIAVWNSSVLPARFEWVKDGAGIFQTGDAVVPLTMYDNNQLARLAKTANDFSWDLQGICNVRIGDPANPFYAARGLFDSLSTDEAGVLITTETLIRSYPDYSAVKE